MRQLYLNSIMGSIDFHGIDKESYAAGYRSPLKESLRDIKYLIQMRRNKIRAFKSPATTARTKAAAYHIPSAPLSPPSPCEDYQLHFSDPQIPKRSALLQNGKLSSSTFDRYLIPWWNPIPDAVEFRVFPLHLLPSFSQQTVKDLNLKVRKTFREAQVYFRQTVPQRLLMLEQECREWVLAVPPSPRLFCVV